MEIFQFGDKKPLEDGSLVLLHLLDLGLQLSPILGMVSTNLSIVTIFGLNTKFLVNATSVIKGLSSSRSGDIFFRFDNNEGLKFGDFKYSTYK